MGQRIGELIVSSRDKEKLLGFIIKKLKPLELFPVKEDFLVLAREWNSWYPSVYSWIGFMSDTDGSMQYLNYYKGFYDECNILIPHLGSIHGVPNGYKHLYLTGLEELLKKLDKKNIF